ncbi:ATP-binding cassette subfamily B protein [Kineococcus xinjiangensis]|uniref:ATP-binding cassette subfamily B protein n=1 Tax=Kineococcus xinjiangensis TaxID=512762 RepID=A0A2S6IWT6_9ACTN|nr:ABC transporter ATP-binding protein [Kineococcus xinjiangensis]PPK98621.1 ATP-binding cassette subfamily B protein [Kineococcus xinjiangensis]
MANEHSTATGTAARPEPTRPEPTRPEPAVSPAPAPLSPRAAGRMLLPHLRRHRGALAVAVLLSLLAAAATLLQPLLVGQVVAAVRAGEALGPWVAALVAVLLIAAVAGGLQQFLLERAGAGVVLQVRRALAGHLLRITVAERDRRVSGDLLSRVSGDTTALSSVVTSGLFDIVGVVLTAAGALVLMGVLDPVLLGVTVAAVAAGITTGLVATRRLSAVELASRERVGAMSAAVARVLSSLRTIRASGATERELAVVAEAARQARDASVRAARVRAAVSPLMGLAFQGAFIAVLGVGGARVAAGSTTVAELVTFVLLLFTLIFPLGQIFGVWTVLQSGIAALTRIDEVMRLEVERDEPRAAAPPTAGHGAPAVEFDAVTFTHPGGERALHEVSFAVPRGTRTALVGPSGAGKSTALGLVERFADVDSGAVRLDGVDVRDLPLGGLRARLGYVEQDAPVLAGTLRANLVLASPDASDAQVQEVLAAVGLSDLATRSPAGLDAEVGEAGVLLSGGQRQRLAIARALLAGAEVLLLDEPTASLDARNEALLKQALDAAAAQRTLLVVAHRLSTVVDCEQIVVLDGGRVLARGTHEELLVTSPLYRELAETQLLVRADAAGEPAPGPA